MKIVEWAGGGFLETVYFAGTDSGGLFVWTTDATKAKRFESEHEARSTFALWTSNMINVVSEHK